MANTQAEAVESAGRRLNPNKLTLVMRADLKRPGKTSIIVYRGDELAEYVTLEPATRHGFSCKRGVYYMGMLPSGQEVEQLLRDAKLLPAKAD